MKIIFNATHTQMQAQSCRSVFILLIWEICEQNKLKKFRNGLKNEQC